MCYQISFILRAYYHPRVSVSINWLQKYISGCASTIHLIHNILINSNLIIQTYDLGPNWCTVYHIWSSHSYSLESNYGVQGSFNSLKWIDSTRLFKLRNRQIDIYWKNCSLNAFLFTNHYKLNQMFVYSREFSYII